MHEFKLWFWCSHSCDCEIKIGFRCSVLFRGVIFATMKEPIDIMAPKKAQFPTLDTFQGLGSGHFVSALIEN